MKLRWQSLIVVMVLVTLVAAGCARLTTAPVVAVAPQSVSPGGVIQVTADGFGSNIDVQVGAGPDGADFTIEETAQTDPNGELTTELTIPETAQPGVQWIVVVRENESRGEQAISAPFEITGEPAAPTATPPPEPTESPAPTATPDQATEVVISPVTGPPGTEVRLVASGLPANTNVEIGVGRADSEYDIVSSDVVDENGELDARVVIPEYAEPGERWVVVIDAAEPVIKEVSNEFSVIAEAASTTIAISPLSGPPGTEIAVTASGLPADSPLEIGIGMVDSEYDVVQTGQSDVNGEFSTQVTVPDDAEPGQEWVIVVSAAEHTTEALSEPFLVTGEEEPPAVSIAPLSGPPGTQVQVTASGFPANTEVQVGAGRQGSEFGVTKRVDTDAQGRVATSITIPDFAEPGDPWGVVVRVVAQGGARASSDTFQVTQPENLFERTNIYLIAVGDEGASGKEIGCGDSVVPVEIPIEPTIAPLTAGIKALLAIDSEMYGQSGLYNALYRSDLSVESVAIQDREAVIRLSGTLEIGGACDAPRVRAQLEETALQFSTVDSVSIFLNEDSLQTYLDAQ